MPNISTELADLAIIRGILIARVANNLTATTANAYQAVIDDIYQAVRSAESDIVLKNLKVTIAELQTLVISNEHILKDELIELSHSEALYTLNSTNAVVGADIMKKFPPEKTINRIYAVSLMNSGGGAAEIPKWFKSVDDSMKKDVEQVVKLGVVNGETNIEIANRLKKKLNMTKGEAERIARTTAQHITEEARMSVYRENEDIIKGYERLETLDASTCYVCGVADGKFFPLGTKPPNRYHLNCRGINNVVLKSWKELDMPELSELPTGTRASMDGQVSGKIKFDKWIDTKDDKFIKDYLGTSRFKMYKDKKLSLSDFVNNKNEILTVKSLNEKYGKVDKVLKKEIFNASNISELSGEKFMLDRWINKSVGIRRAYGTTMPNKDLMDDFNIIFKKDGDYKGVIHRGLDFSGTKSLEKIYNTISNAKVGEILESDVAPASWSKSIEQASKFAKGNKGVIFTMKKYNTYGYDIENISKYKFEKEVMMKPNIKIKIAKREFKDGLLYIELEEI